MVSAWLKKYIFLRSIQVLINPAITRWPFHRKHNFNIYFFKPINDSLIAHFYQMWAHQLRLHVKQFSYMSTSWHLNMKKSLIKEFGKS